MSLLPGRILPQTEPFGTLSEDGKTVIIDKNWWLWAYNVSLQSIGTGTGIPADQLIDLESVDIDSVGTDASALRAPLAALANLIPTEGDPVPSLQDVRNALLLAYSALDAVDAIVSGFAAPSAKVGLTAVAGTAYTAMRSDASPPLDQTIIPTMTGLWTFNGKVVVGAPASGTALTVTGVAATIAMSVSTPSDTQLAVNALTTGQFSTLQFTQNTSTLVGQVYTDNTGNTLNLTTNNAAGATIKFWPGTGVAAKATLSTSGLVLVNGIAINGVAAPPAQVTGFGTPVGGAVIAAYNITDAGGANSNTNKCVAEILTILKAHGMIGA